MAPIASVHLADVGLAGTLSAFRRTGRLTGEVDGLRRADAALATPLSASGFRVPRIGRVGLVAFWDDEDALDRFLATHPLAEAMAGGWRARLEPLRAFGSWPGLADDVPHGRVTSYDGPSVVVTLGRLRLPEAPRFLRTSAKAEGAALASPGMVWGTAMAKPPFVATCSLWSSVEAVREYAYASGEAAHPTAIQVDRAKPFHHMSAFIRFRPIAIEGSLAGTNPLWEQALAV